MIRRGSPATYRDRWAAIACRAAAGLCLIAVAMPAAAATPIRVTTPWFRYLLPSLPAGGYMRLDNENGHAIRLIDASSPACGSMMLHKTVRRNGVEKMVAVPGITIPAHGQFSFEPGAYHVMCMHPKMERHENVRVTLRFAHMPAETVPFTVYGATGRPAGK